MMKKSNFLMADMKDKINYEYRNGIYARDDMWKWKNSADFS